MKYKWRQTRVQYRKVAYCLHTTAWSDCCLMRCNVVVVSAELLRRLQLKLWVTFLSCLETLNSTLDASPSFSCRRNGKRNHGWDGKIWKPFKQMIFPQQGWESSCWSRWQDDAAFPTLKTEANRLSCLNLGVCCSFDGEKQIYKGRRIFAAVVFLVLIHWMRQTHFL